MLDRLQELRSRALAELSRATDTNQLQDWRVAFLGKKGPLTELLRELGRLPAGERPAVGQAANTVKTDLESAFDARERDLKALELQKALT